MPDDEAPVATLPPTTPTAFSRLSTRAGDAMQGGSLWVAFVAGAWLATPLQYVAALTAILASGTSAGTQVVALVAYHVVALAFAEIPLVSQLVAPEKTQTVMLRALHAAGGARPGSSPRRSSRQRPAPAPCRSPASG